MHVAAAFDHLAFVGLEIEVEMSERMVLDRPCAVAKRLELGQAFGGGGAPAAEVPRMDERALKAGVGQRFVRVFLEPRGGGDGAHRAGSFWLSPIAGPSAIPARTSAI